MLGVYSGLHTSGLDETAIGAAVTIAATGANVGATVVTDTAIGASVVIVSIDIATGIECDIDIDI